MKMQIPFAASCAAVLLMGAVAVPGHAADAPQFVKFRPIIVSTFDDTRVSGLLSVTVHVQARDRAARQRLERARPKLQDAFTCAAIELGQLYVSPERRINVQLLAARLQAAATAAFPGEQLRVYVVDASSRRV
jgi:hypothetical protein